MLRTISKSLSKERFAVLIDIDNNLRTRHVSPRRYRTVDMRDPCCPLELVPDPSHNVLLIPPLHWPDHEHPLKLCLYLQNTCATKDKLGRQKLVHDDREERYPKSSKSGKYG